MESSIVGQSFGNYQVLRAIASGGMGEVYLAEHVLMRKKAAIKVLRKDIAKEPAVLSRFFNEAESAGIIEHPGIVDIYDCGFDDSGSAYLVMEYLEGEDLRDRISRLGKLTPAEAIAIASEVASTLVASHARGILHRDIKPSNVFLCRDPSNERGERARVLDFGIAKLLPDANVDSADLTAAADVLGSPPYMSPEQCIASRDIDHRADVYSLGCLLYESLCGVTPFRCPNFVCYREAHLSETPVPPSERGARVGPDIDALILKALAKRPDDRFQSIAEMHRALEAARPRLASAPPTSSGDDSEKTTTELPVEPWKKRRQDLDREIAGWAPPATNVSRRRKRAFGLAGLAAVLATLVTLYVVRGSSDMDAAKVSSPVGIDAAVPAIEAAPSPTPAETTSPVDVALDTADAQTASGRAPAPAPASPGDALAPTTLADVVEAEPERAEPLEPIPAEASKPPPLYSDIDDDKKKPSAGRHQRLQSGQKKRAPQPQGNKPPPTNTVAPAAEDSTVDPFVEGR